jgi:hypothetical protein
MEMMYGNKPEISEIVNKKLRPHEINPKCLKSVNL